MRRDDAIARLKAAEPEIRPLGIAALYVFGSVARDGATAESDLDVFVEPAPGHPLGLNAFMGTYERLRARFPGVALGYGTRDGLSPFIRDRVEREAIRVF